ncbi:MAG: preprotein translocase subunit SecE [Solirubrobacterales bacterium]|nr:preprotein translocase subunit SecE [Solirubrobacterales bacterium]
MARKRPKDDDQDPIHREGVPGDLDHASGNVDAFGAEIVRGGDGEEFDATSEAELSRQAAAAAPSGVPLKDGVVKPSRGIGRFPGFLRASWAELQRVQWPDRRQVAQATAVVLGFVVIAGAYLGLADAVASRFVDLIL